MQNISAHVGSTVLLPCKWSNLSIQTPHVVWTTDGGVVFERASTEAMEGVGYEGRVNVSLDQLRKGNCSLVLKNVRVTDAGVYRSGMVVRHTSEMTLVQKVKLSVSGEWSLISEQSVRRISAHTLQTWKDLTSAAYLTYCRYFSVLGSECTTHLPLLSCT